MTAEFQQSHVHASRFQLLRILALAAIGVTVGLYLLTLPLFSETLRTVCSSPPCFFLQLNATGVSSLEAVGLSLDTYTVSIISIRLVFVIIFLFITGLLLLNRSNDGFALFVAVTLVMFACGTFSDEI